MCVCMEAIHELHRNMEEKKREKERKAAAQVCVCMCVCLSVCLSAYACVYVYAFFCTHTHTHPLPSQPPSQSTISIDDDFSEELHREPRVSSVEDADAGRVTGPDLVVAGEDVVMSDDESAVDDRPHYMTVQGRQREELKTSVDAKTGEIGGLGVMSDV